MADFVVYTLNPSQVEVRPGQPPEDQSALVAQLQADLAAMTAERDALQAKVNSARVEAQQTVEALA